MEEKASVSKSGTSRSRSETPGGLKGRLMRHHLRAHKKQAEGGEDDMTHRPLLATEAALDSEDRVLQQRRNIAAGSFTHTF